MDQQEQARVNRVVQALTNQRNSAMNEMANLAALLQERDEAIAMLQKTLAQAMAPKTTIEVHDGIGGSREESILEK